MDEQVKQKLQKLLEYQKKDIELRKLNDQLGKDESRIVMNRSRRAFNDAKQTIDDCEAQAGTILDSYADLQSYIDETEKLFNELGSMDEVSDEELEARIRKLDSLRQKFASAEKKLHDTEEKSKAVCNKRADALKTGKAAQQKFAEAKEKYNKLLGSKADLISSLQASLDAIKKELDPKLFAEYEKLVADNKFPPVVPAAGDEKKNAFNCGGCGLGLPQSGNATIANQGWCRCDNCHRIIVNFK
ncbi:MAG: hypothetical protein HDT28_03235 [Clostridiales bacterium]|nr:hypothetical protein [Clostridiales bacterium]